jgi:ubiquitin
MLVLPEDKCASMTDFEAGKCVPCPVGSVINTHIMECQWCTQNSYFNEHLDDYFKSECDLCPVGTVGGYEMECLPCEAGTVFDPAASFQQCRRCSEKSLCPVGTKYEFPADEYLPHLGKFETRNVPETFVPDQDAVDRTAKIVFIIWFFFSLIVLAAVFCSYSKCKEKSLFVFREFDMLPITGGTRKRWVGGVVTTFYFVILAVIITGFLFHYLFYN